MLIAGGGAVDRDAERLRIKERIEAAEKGMTQLRCRRRELGVWPITIYPFWPITAKHVDCARERIHQAAQCARAAQLAAANQLDGSADSHDAVAGIHDSAATNAHSHMLAIEHKHIAEAHRSAARHYRRLANQYRERAEQCNDD